MKLKIDDDLKVYSVKEVALILKMTPVTIRKMIRRNQLKATSINKDYRIRKQDLIDFIKGE